MSDTPEDQCVAVADYHIFDRAVDGGKRPVECRRAGCKAKPASPVVTLYPLTAPASGEAVGDRDLVGTQHIPAEMPMPLLPWLTSSG